MASRLVVGLFHSGGIALDAVHRLTGKSERGRPKMGMINEGSVIVK